MDGLDGVDCGAAGGDGHFIIRITIDRDYRHASFGGPETSTSDAGAGQASGTDGSANRDPMASSSSTVSRKTATTSGSKCRPACARICSTARSRRPGGLVRPRGAKGVEDVGHGDDARGGWNLASGPAIRVTAAVPFLMMVQRDRGRQAQRLVVGDVEDRGTGRRVGLHQAPLVGIERALFQQDAVRDRDLADVVQRAGVEQLFAVGIAPAQPTREQRRGMAHAQDVRAGLVVAVLGGTAEQLGDVELRAAQLDRALLHQRFEQDLLPMQRRPAAVDRDMPMGAGHQLGRIEGLGQVVAGAGTQRPHLQAAPGVAGDDEHRRRVIAADLVQLPQHGPAVQVRHAHVQDHQVEGVGRQHLAQPARVLDQGRRIEVRRAQDPARQAQAGRVVVDDEHPRARLGRRRRRRVRNRRGRDVEGRDRRRRLGARLALHLVDQARHLAAGLENLCHGVGKPASRRQVRLNQLRMALHHVQRCAQVVREAAERIGSGAVRRRAMRQQRVDGIHEAPGLESRRVRRGRPGVVRISDPGRRRPLRPGAWPDAGATPPRRRSARPARRCAAWSRPCSTPPGSPA